MQAFVRNEPKSTEQMSLLRRQKVTGEVNQTQKQALSQTRPRRVEGKLAMMTRPAPKDSEKSGWDQPRR